MQETTLEKEMVEKYPLCTATGQPIADDFTERELEQSMNADQKVHVKIGAGIQPTVKEEQYCVLPYDLPGEIWKEIVDKILHGSGLTPDDICNLLIDITLPGEE